MKKFWLITLLFSLALVLSFDRNVFAQQDPGSLLGTILNETVQQPYSPEGSPWYSHDLQSRNDYYDDRYYDARQGKRITCESRGERYTYCRTNTHGRVRLERQLSDAPCREYYTWGADGDGSGVWVSNGCRATFVVESRRPSYGGGGGAHGGRTFTCKSDGFKHTYCRTGTRGGHIRLVRQLSDAPCREYYTWGADRDGGGVWVDKGCSAEFSVERR